MKTRKAFAKFDLMLYFALVFLIVLLFLFFVILPKNGKSDGFRIYVGDKEVFSFYYSGAYEISEDSDVTVTNADGVYTVTVKLSNGYNVIRANVKNKTVRVTDADCSLRKDCVHSHSLNGDSGVIICAPHNLRVLPMGSGVTPPVTG